MGKGVENIKKSETAFCSTTETNNILDCFIKGPENQFDPDPVTLSFMEAGSSLEPFGLGDEYESDAELSIDSPMEEEGGV